ncbi:MAG: carboxypeptidase regulatory-like domain-containing protein [Thermoplasmata archaeon]|nr:MAG: carboxypeptidase regulatory-like domain-containing protein [Thermoplasmata archaeon]
MKKRLNRLTANIIIFLGICFILLFLFIGSVSAQGGSICGTVIDRNTGEPIANASVSIASSETGDVIATTVTASDGYYNVTGLDAGTYTVTISAEGYLAQYHEVEIQSQTFGGEDAVLLDVDLVPIYEDGGDGNGDGGGWDGDGDRDGGGTGPGDDEKGEGAFHFSLFFQTFFVIIIAILLSLIMYSKIKRENMLKNAVRKRIFDYVNENPGMHYRGILNELNLPMGVLSYHLNRLEKAQYIRSRQDGMYRRFYTKGPKTDMRFFLSDIQESILSVIKENQGISQSKIAERISVSRKVVNYHVNILDQAGLIFVERQGRESACYPRDLRAWEMGQR